MTRSEKLDQILDGLLFIDTKRLKKEQIDKSITIEWLSNSLKLDCEDWEMQSLKQELLENGLITEINGEVFITEKGKRFKVQEKGFKGLEKKVSQEDTIREKTIEKFRYDKISFWISVIAIIIAGLSLILTLKLQ